MEIIAMFTTGLVMGAGMGKLVSVLRTPTALLSFVKAQPPVSRPVAAHG